MATKNFRALAIAFALVVSSCSWTDAAKLLTPAAKDGIQADAEVTVGQKNEDNDVSVDTEVGNTNQKAQTINNNDSGPSGWYILLLVLLAGWAIPGPGRTLIGLKNFWRELRS